MPILMCAAETWTWTKANISRVMAAYTRFLTLTESKTKRDRIRNKIL
jgi:hypothetical protein